MSRNYQNKKKLNLCDLISYGFVNEESGFLEYDTMLIVN